MEKKEKAKKAYKKPTVTQVKLEVEEAILAGCKGAGLSDKGGKGCAHSGCKGVVGT